MLRRKAFTLIELLVVIAIIAILAAILFPVFAQARASARAISCISNVKQFSLGVLMYAQDYDETIPRLKNYGPSGGQFYGSQPTWGDPGTNPNVPPTMFATVVQPYIKNDQVGYCPEAGRTNWRTAIPNGAIYGQPYVPQLEANGTYYGCFAQMAVNILLVEWHPQASWQATTIGGPIGSISAWARPAELVLLTGDSVWDTGGVATSAAVGNTGIWPYRPGTSCTNYGGPSGWTWYLHKGTSRTGTPTAPTYSTGINSGLANIAFGDGHAKALKYNALERCDFSTAANAWAWTFFDPRF
jgi:prepilin-type N-terminal cleavage/methylation domain-containing protein/prepilin-type processing-associated H-X9-DG protein